MASIQQLTPEQLFTAVSAAGDSTGRIGRWNYDAFVSWIQIMPPVMQPLSLAYNEAVALITAAGLNPSNLTDTEAADAFYGMAFAAAYRLLLIDATGASSLPAENFQTARSEFGQRVTAFYQLAGKHYDQVGIARTANPYWDAAQWQGTFDIVTRNDATDGYPFNNSFTTIP